MLKQKDDIIDAMINELRLTTFSPNGRDVERIETIYFGGGTPSVLSAGELNRLLTAVYEKYEVEKDAEITLEANPDDIDEIKLAEWRSIGINRFSIGIQSFIQEDLNWMNRVHTAEQALHCIQLVKDAGFKNYSVDIIYGTPGLSDDDFKRNVQTLIESNVPHISCYALTVEVKTPLYKMISLKKRDDIDDEKQASQFLLLMHWLEEAGYEHYEISNFAKPGFRSKHNSSYWQGKSYMGVGPSAHSFDGNSRRWNVSNNALYIQSLRKNIIPYDEEILKDVQKLNEYIMTSLRTIEGINLDYVKKTFGEAVSRKLQVASSKWSDKIKNVGDQIILTPQGKLFADGIAADLFVEEEVNALQI